MTEALGCAGVPGWSGEIGAAGGGAPDKEAWFGLFQPPPFGLLAPMVVTAQWAVFTHTSGLRCFACGGQGTVTCALNLRSHHPAFINAGVAELQRPIS